MAIKYEAFDLVRLKDRTDVYRVYTYAGRYIFVGQNSDTVTDERKDTVVEVIKNG